MATESNGWTVIHRADMHDLMDLVGVFSEDCFGKAKGDPPGCWHEHVQVSRNPNERKENVNILIRDNGDGSMDLAFKANPEDLGNQFREKHGI